MVAGGSVGRMGSFAELIAKELGHPKVTKEELSISKTDRFSFFKIGPVLSISVSDTYDYSCETSANQLVLSGCLHSWWFVV